jgi:hypothetical protein
VIERLGLIVSSGKVLFTIELVLRVYLADIQHAAKAQIEIVACAAVVAIPYQCLEKVSTRCKSRTTQGLESAYSLTTVANCSKESLCDFQSVWVVMSKRGFEKPVKVLCSNKE